MTRAPGMPLATRARQAAARSPDRTAWLAVGALMVGDGVLLVRQAGRRPLWLDEALSTALAQAPAGDLWSVLTDREANGTLYYLLLRPFAAAGSSPLAVRLLSVALAVAALPLLFALVRRLASSGVALVATLALAVNPFFLEYGREAKPEMLAVVAVLAAAIALVRAIGSGRRRDWITYGVIAGLSLYTHLFAAPALAAQLAAALVVHRRTLPWPRLAEALAVAGVIGLPMVVFAATSGGAQVDWVPDLTVRAGRDFIRRLIGVTHLRMGVVHAALAAAAVGAAVLGLRGPAAGQRRWPTALAASWVVLPVGATVAVSAVRPLFVDRYLLVVLPGWCLLVALGVWVLPRPALRLAAAAAVVVLAVPALGDWRRAPAVENWSAATAVVAREGRPGDAVFVYPSYARFPFGHAARDREEPWLRRPTWPPIGWMDVQAERQPRPGEATSVLAGYDRVWLVVRDIAVDPDDAVRFYDEFERTFEADRRYPIPSETGVALYLYRRRS